MQIISTVLFTVASGMLFVQSYWNKYDVTFYLISCLSALAVIIACIIYGSLYKHIDTWLIILFFFYVYVSIKISYGFSGALSSKQFFSIWALIFSLYFIMQTAPDIRLLLRVFCAVSVLPLGYICVSVLLTATHSICKEIPPHDTFNGSFELGRLCGLDNANVMGFVCTTLILIALFGLLHCRKWFRAYYIAALLLGWFVLGLTNCRNAIIGVSFTVSICVFLVLQRSIITMSTSRTFIRWVLLISIAIAFFALTVMLFYLPFHIYRFVSRLYGEWRHNTYLLNNLTRLSTRQIVDDDGTFTDRIMTWKQSIPVIFSTPRRALFGVSPLNYDGFAGFYEGHHEIVVAHTHNLILEIIRLYGIFGFIPFMCLIIYWCAAAVKMMVDRSVKTPDLFPAAAIFGMLIMSIPEPLPILGAWTFFLSVPFVVYCGYCIRYRRDVK